MTECSIITSCVTLISIRHFNYLFNKTHNLYREPVYYNYKLIVVKSLVFIRHPVCDRLTIWQTIWHNIRNSKHLFWQITVNSSAATIKIYVVCTSFEIFHFVYICTKITCILYTCVSTIVRKSNNSNSMERLCYLFADVYTFFHRQTFSSLATRVYAKYQLPNWIDARKQINFISEELTSKAIIRVYGLCRIPHGHNLGKSFTRATGRNRATCIYIKKHIFLQECICILFVFPLEKIRHEEKVKNTQRKKVKNWMNSDEIK